MAVADGAPDPVNQLGVLSLPRAFFLTKRPGEGVYFLGRTPQVANANRLSGSNGEKAGVFLSARSSH